MNEHGIIYRFSEYELCPQTRDLLRNGKRVKIQERIFCLLAYLVGNSDRAITKEELVDAIWEGKPISETVIPRAIMKARRAIGDDSDPPKRIRTIRGYGYRFTDTPEIVQCPDVLTDSDSGDRDAERVGHEARGLIGAGSKLTWPASERWLVVLFITAILALGILIGEHLPYAPLGDDREPNLAGDTGKIEVIMLSVASSDEHLQIMTTRVATLLSTRLSTVPWIEFEHFSELDQQNFAGRKVCLLTIALDKIGSEYSIAYSLTIPDIEPVKGTLTDENPFLSAEKLVTIVSDFTSGISGAEGLPGASDDRVVNVSLEETAMGEAGHDCAGAFPGGNGGERAASPPL